MILTSPIRLGSGLVVERTPETDFELWVVTQALWGLKIPRVKVCANHDAPFKTFADNFFGREPVIVLKGSRGLSGKSYMGAGLGLTNAALWGCKVNVLGGSASQSVNVHEHMTTSWDYWNAPKHLLVEDPSKFETKLTNGGKIRALMASSRSVRGPHPARLLLDEIDEMELRILDDAMGMPMHQTLANGVVVKASTLMMSTHQYPDRTMTAMIRRAREKGWPLRENCLVEGTQVVTRTGVVEIQDLVPGQHEVMTRAGWKPIQHVTYMGEQECVRVDTTTGHFVLTPDHKVAGPEGWLLAGQLLPGTPLPVLFPLALSAATPPLLGDVDVLGVEHAVAGRASSRSLGMLPRTPLVLPWRDWFEVPDVDTASVATGVIEVEPWGDRPHKLLVDPAVRLHAGLAGVLDAVVASHGVRPLDALVGVDGELLRVDSAAPGDAGEGVRAWLAPGGPGVLQGSSAVLAVRHHGKAPVYDIGVYGQHEFTLVGGNVVSNCYRESANPIDGWLSIDLIHQKRREISNEMWRIEYELGEPAIEGRAVATEHVIRMYDRNRDWPELGKYAAFEGANGKEYIFEQPIPGVMYATGVDWARTKDWTVIDTWRTDTWERVAWMRVQKRTWPEMIGMAIRRFQKYPGHLAHDSTGLGDVIAGVFPEYMRSQNQIHDIVMVGNTRATLFSEFVTAAEQDTFASPYIEPAHDELLYTTHDDLYRAGTKFHPPDSVVAHALAWHLRGEKRIYVAPVVDGLDKPGAEGWLVQQDNWSFTTNSDDAYRIDL